MLPKYKATILSTGEAQWFNSYYAMETAYGLSDTIIRNHMDTGRPASGILFERCTQRFPEESASEYVYRMQDKMTVRRLAYVLKVSSDDVRRLYDKALKEHQNDNRKRNRRLSKGERVDGSSDYEG